MAKCRCFLKLKIKNFGYDKTKIKPNKKQNGGNNNSTFQRLNGQNGKNMGVII